MGNDQGRENAELSHPKAARLETDERGDLRWGTVPGLLRSSAERFGGGAAIVDTDGSGNTVTVTFTELEAKSRAVAKSLMALGTEAGDRVALWAPNMWEWEVSALGIVCAGAAIVPMNTRFKGAEAEYLLNKSRPRTLLLAPGDLEIDYVAMVRDPKRTIETVDNVVVIRGVATEDAIGWEAFLQLGEHVSDASLDARIASVSPSDWCDISFTSGTTGNPKAATCRHSQLLRATRDWVKLPGFYAGVLV